MRYDEPRGAELPLPDLLRQLASDTGTLVRQEIALARAELVQKATHVGKSAGFFAAAAVLALGLFGALTTALIAALALVLPLWAAALIITVVYAAAAAVAALQGKAALQKVPSLVPQEAVRNIRRDVDAVRTGVERGR